MGLHYVSGREAVKILIGYGGTKQRYVFCRSLPHTIDGSPMRVAVEDLYDAGLLCPLPQIPRYRNPYKVTTIPSGTTDTCANGHAIKGPACVVNDTALVVVDGVRTFPVRCAKCFYSWLRERQPCYICGGKPGHDGHYGTIEHLVPRHQFGSSHPDNLAPCCFSCNTMKAHRSEEEFEVVREGINDLRAQYRRMLDDAPEFEQLALWGI